MMKLEIKGVSFEYVEDGEGEVVIFVHGSVSDYRTWHLQQVEFAKHFRTVSYSRRFHYPNEQITEDKDYSMTEQVDDLQAIIHSLSNNSVHLVGHSYGAFLCLLLAIKEPAIVRSLVLAEPPAITLFVTIPPKPQDILKLLFTRPKTAIALIRFVVTGISPATSAIQQDDIDKAIRIFGTAVLGKEAFNDLSAERMEQVRANLIKSEFLGSGFAPLNPANVSAIQAPTLLIVGENSQNIFRKLVVRLHELLPNSERINVPSASHITHEDNKSFYNEAVLSFIKKVT